MADKYADHDTLGTAPDNSVVPALVNTPVMFIAPSAHTVSSGELWMAVSCADSDYGGCVVWLSNTGDEYREIRRIEGQPIVGVLSADLTSATGTDTINTLSVDFTGTLPSDLYGRTVLESAHDDDYARGEPLCYVGGEFLVFKVATLSDVGKYDLTHLERGLYGSATGSSIGDQFALLKDGIFRYKFNQAAVSGDLYFKFQGFNTVGGGIQDLADCVEYVITLGADGGVRALLSDVAAATTGKENISNKVIAWSITPNDTHYPSEKLVKDSLDALSAPDLSAYAPLSSPELTGTPKAPTADLGTATTQIATTAFVGLADADILTAAKNYTDTATTGLLQDCGTYDASSNFWPSSGGSGAGGAIVKGDVWYLSVGGALGGVYYESHTSVRALTDTPGQTATNWAALEGAFGYVPENINNKSNSTGDIASATKYPVWSIVVSWAITTWQPLSAKLTAIAALAATNGYAIVGNGSTFVLQLLGNAASKNVGTASTDVAAGNRGLPSGGTANQVLSKIDGTDYNVNWITPSSGSGGAILGYACWGMKFQAQSATVLTFQGQFFSQSTGSLANFNGISGCVLPPTSSGSPSNHGVFTLPAGTYSIAITGHLTVAGTSISFTLTDSAGTVNFPDVSVYGNQSSGTATSTVSAVIRSFHLFTLTGTTNLYISNGTLGSITGTSLNSSTPSSAMLIFEVKKLA